MSEKKPSDGNSIRARQNSKVQSKLMDQNGDKTKLMEPNGERQEDYEEQQQLDQKQPSPCYQYVVSWALFVAAYAVYIGLWAMNKFALKNAQTSHYYANDFAVSSYLKLNAPTSSLNMLGASINSQGGAVAASIFYSWIMWKLPLAIYTFTLVENCTRKIRKVASILVYFITLLFLDILLTSLAISIYSDWFFFAINGISTLIVNLVNKVDNVHKLKKPMCDVLIPLGYIIILYVFLTLFIPSIFKIQVGNLDYGGVFIYFYLFPFIELALYSGMLVLGTLLSKKAKRFYQTLHYILIGYGVGTILLVGFTEVEFYYLLGYYVVRNVFLHWVMWKWDSKINNPSCLPSWGIIYYVSYLLNFLPVIGIGKLVISQGFYSQQWAITQTILYPTPSSLYISSTFDNNSELQGINFPINGNILWISGLIIWVLLTFSQKYPRRKPSWRDFFNCLIGIYFFYIGISSGLQIYILKDNSLK